MCGIAGYLGLAGPPLDLAAALERLAHRGPDGQGLHLSPTRGAGIGARRLAIIDVARGDQPMANETGDVHAVLNGEIFNHHLLRRELEELGHRFVSRCDTEVLVHGYEEWGAGLPERLEGEFAFAVLDERGPRPALFLARDRFGIRPLFLARRGEGVAFASEPKGLFPLLSHAPELDLSQLAPYLAVGYVPRPATIWQGVEKFPEASWELFGGDDPIRGIYWRLPDPEPTTRRSEELVLEGMHLLEAAVARRMESEVPLGTFLSGGLDSSALVALQPEVPGRTPLTFSAGFGEQAYDERPFAEEVAAYHGTEHHHFQVDPGDLWSLVDRLNEAFDEPFGDSSSVAGYLLAQEARRHITVALAGDGGDEVFAGYHHLRLHRLGDWARLVPGPLRALSLGAVRLLRAALGRGVYRLRWMEEVLGLARESAWGRHLGFTLLVDEEELSGWCPGYSPGAVTARLSARRRPGLDPLDQVAAFDLQETMVDNFVTKLDRVASAHSLEVRVPFLDTALVEWAARLPVREKMRGLELKSLLRAGLTGHLPAGILRRRKHGFVVPTLPWFRGPLADRLVSELTGRDSALGDVLDAGHTRRVVDGTLSGEEDRSLVLWRLLVLERWLRARA